jgi:hypothetical protein
MPAPFLFNGRTVVHARLLYTFAFAQIWLAHRDHKVRALAITPWGELWTGSTYGTMRVWACNHAVGAGEAHSLLRNLAVICLNRFTFRRAVMLLG